MYKNINKLLIKYLSEIIKNIIIEDKNNLITVTHTKINKDLSNMHIYISILKNENNILKYLNYSSKKIRHHLSLKLKYNKMPILKFYLDKSIDYENEISILIEKTKNKNE